MGEGRKTKMLQALGIAIGVAGMVLGMAPARTRPSYQGRGLS